MAEFANAPAVAVGDARSAMMKNGKWQGRITADLAQAVKQVVMDKQYNVLGTVGTLSICPENGVRQPVWKVEAFQSIRGDCQNHDGFVKIGTSAAVKNEGSALLGEENLLVESLLSGVSIGDEDLVRQVVAGAKTPRTAEVWATGDNVYLSNLDMTWTNFKIGDLLVFQDHSGHDTGVSGAAQLTAAQFAEEGLAESSASNITAVVLNQGYPHFACWKYAVRAGDQPRAYVNSEEGTALRMRGIKGSFLLPLRREGGPCATISKGSSVRIVRKGSPEYAHIVQMCTPPIKRGTELVFQMHGQVMRAAAGDTQAYIDLLCFAGREAALADLERYKRSVPGVLLEAINATSGPFLDSNRMEVSAAAKSGDGSIDNVGIKMDAEFGCKHCKQRFGTQKALDIHGKFMSGQHMTLMTSVSTFYCHQSGTLLRWD